MLENFIEYFRIKDALYANSDVVPASEGDGNVEEILRRFDKHKKAIILSLEPHLKVFEGLGKLEAIVDSVRKIKVNAYSSHAESFKAAADAMYDIVNKVHPIRFGIIGMGNMGTSHAKSILAGKVRGMRITAVADTTPEKLLWSKENLPWAKTFNSAEELIESGEVDALIICTPHYSHPEHVMKALKNGIHVVSEKPAGVYT